MLSALYQWTPFFELGFDQGTATSVTKSPLTITLGVVCFSLGSRVRGNDGGVRGNDGWGWGTLMHCKWVERKSHHSSWLSHSRLVALSVIRRSL